jgi:hypothetical protein
MVKIFKNKSGWIRIVEAVVAILLIAGILLLVVGRDSPEQTTDSERIHTLQISILREIQLNEELRSEILDSTPPLEGTDFETNLPNTFSKIEEKTPGYLECRGKICSITDSCILSNLPERTVYAESIFISSDLQAYGPKVLKLFCWDI